MEMWTPETCSKYERDTSLPQEISERVGNNCLNCKHALKVTHSGEIDIAPCGKPVPVKGTFPSPK